MVGRVGVEPTTSRLSGVRSNHLSYRPPYLDSLKRRRSHPRAWLSSHKLGRAFALAASGRESELRRAPAARLLGRGDLQDEGT